MIQVSEVSMNYGSVRALDNLSFSVKKGEIIGLLGPNGAGKSTLMKILTTFIVPASGKVTIGGINTDKNPIQVRSMIGYLPETAPLCSDMLTIDYLKFVGRARGMNKHKISERIAWVADACELKTVFHKSIVELSRGYKQRVGLAQALIHDPEILILDEPTSGLDPLQIIGIRELIRSLVPQKTIIFSTHILQEVTATSDRVVVINEGRLVADGLTSDLKQKAMRLNRTYLALVAPREDVERELPGLTSLKSFEFCTEKDDVSTFELRHRFDKPIWNEIDSLIKENGWVVRSLSEKPITFEETFIALTRDALLKTGVEIE